MSNIDFGTSYKRFVRYFWDPEPKNDDPDRAPIWCLGQRYSAEDHTDAVSSQTSDPTSPSFDLTTDNETVIIHNDHPSQRTTDNTNSRLVAESSTSEEERGWPSDFLDDFESRFWFTYRSHFPPIARSADPQSGSALTFAVRIRSQLGDQAGFTSDTGWGCMIRSGQSVIANALARLKLGRDWRRGTEQSKERQLLSWFADDPTAPYSIHRFVAHGASACGKHPGEWFGPSATARCIQALSHAHQESGLKVYLTGDGPDVYEESVLKLAKEDDLSGRTFTPVLILAGTRLGIDRVNPVYWDSLKQCLRLPQSIGIAGGRPSASHYFVGSQSSQIFYLDPHQTRPALPFHTSPDQYTHEEISTCHTRRLRRLDINQMDPSMLIAFLITSESDWRSWKQAMQEVQGKCAVHISLREASIGGLEDMVLSEAEDGDEGACTHTVHREETAVQGAGTVVYQDEGDGEWIEKHKERQEAVDEVEVLPDDEDEQQQQQQHQAGRTTPTATHAARHGQELGEDDGEIINLPTPTI